MDKARTMSGLPVSVLIFSSGVTGVSSVLVLLSFWFRTVRLSRGAVRRQISPFEKRLALVHYALCLPLFELLVVWGPLVDSSIQPSEPFVILFWICVQLSQSLALVAAMFSRRNYRMMVHVAQILQFPCMAAFFCERLYRRVINVEGMIISALIVCGIIEIYTVPDFFRDDSPIYTSNYSMTVRHLGDDDSADEGLGRPPPIPYEDEESGFTSEMDDPFNRTNAEVIERREKERLLAEVVQKLMEADVNWGVKKLRELLSECQQMLMSAFQSGTTESSATTDSARNGKRHSGQFGAQSGVVGTVQSLHRQASIGGQMTAAQRRHTSARFRESQNLDISCDSEAGAF